MLTELKQISETPVPVFEFHHGKSHFPIALVGDFLHQFENDEPGKRFKCLQNSARFKIYRGDVQKHHQGYVLFVLDKQQQSVLYSKDDPHSIVKLFTDLNLYEIESETPINPEIGGNDDGKSG